MWLDLRKKQGLFVGGVFALFMQSRVSSFFFPTSPPLLKVFPSLSGLIASDRKLLSETGTTFCGVLTKTGLKRPWGSKMETIINLLKREL